MSISEITLNRLQKPAIFKLLEKILTHIGGRPRGEGRSMETSKA
jgi:hypothetical protein